ncbi:unnamed protein product [Kuraishia capsulata CBS 1993]|uniref:L-type lectin-like domain-containing protein n=1 Tax=Kuraishia capsulata CBS 1993 TaxID=1382522 RepID=W6MRQ4_9ASCO|nr:uncharacterized protein KUCA_T00005019001 [Kuraishia capsulata CBS 1993]CDK29033.1 unnamed protein product [Kuraishia capsulata CBS 1993]
MDIGDANIVFKLKKRYRRSSPTQRLVVGLVSLLVLYLLWPSSKGKSASSFEDFSSQVLQEDSESADYEVKRSEVAYLALKPPFFNPSTLSLFNYQNGGNMMINRKDNKVRLVRDSPHQVGYLTSNLPIGVSSGKAFELNAEFSVNGPVVRNGLYGDGMAIWLSETPLEQGDVFGLRDGTRGLGIFVDTYKNGPKGKSHGNNNQFPYCSIQHNTDGIPHYDKSRDGANTEIGGCSLKGIYNAEGNALMRLLYIRSQGYLMVEFDMKSDGNWKKCVETTGVDLPESMYLGFSAETGDLMHNVDLFQASVYELSASNGEPVTSPDTVAPLYATEESSKEINDKADATKKAGNRRLPKRKGGPRRRTMSRLKRSEEKAKLKAKEQPSVVHSFFGFIWRLIKMTLYAVLFIIVSYIAWCVYRVQREKAKRRKQGGLL